MKILALEHEKQFTHAQDFAPHLKAEAAQIWQLQQSDMLREIYFNAQQHTAVLVMECVSLEEARETLDQLPLVKAGLIDFEIIELAPYDGFARLFAESSLD